MMHVPVHGSPWCLSKTVAPHLVELQTLNAYRPYASWTGVCLPVTSFCAKCPDKGGGGGGGVKIEVAVLGSPSLISLVVSVDVKQHLEKVNQMGPRTCICSLTELKRRNFSFTGYSEFRSCVKVEVAVLGCPS